MARKDIIRRSSEDRSAAATNDVSTGPRGPLPRPAKRRNPSADADAEQVVTEEQAEKLRPASSGHESLIGDLEAIASMGADEFAQLMGASGSLRLPEPGEEVTGTISHLGDEAALIDLGGKSEGWISREELAENARVGDTLRALVLRVDEGGVRLSRQLSGSEAGQWLDEAHASKTPVQGQVSQRNSGGFVIAMGSTRAFCPTSHIDRVPGEDLDRFIGQTLEFRVLEVEPRPVLSRRVIQEEALAEAVDAFWSTVRDGSEHDALVTGLKPHGAYVDINGVNALVPRSEISWEPVDDPSTALHRGQRVRVRLITVDQSARRLTASIRATEALGESSSGEQSGGGAFAAAFANARKKRR